MKKMISTCLLLMVFTVTFGDGFVLPDFCVEKADGFYADPLNCNYFYMCQQKKQYHLKCQKGLAFDPKCLCCNWPENATCKDESKSAERIGCSCSTGFGVGFFYECSDKYETTIYCTQDSPCYDSKFPSSIC